MDTNMDFDMYDFMPQFIPDIEHTNVLLVTFFMFAAHSWMFPQLFHIITW